MNFFPVFTKTISMQKLIYLTLFLFFGSGTYAQELKAPFEPSSTMHFVESEANSTGSLPQLKSTRPFRLFPALFSGIRKVNKPFKFPSYDDGVYIDFVGTGDIQKTVSEGQDIQANTGLGIIYERVNADTNRFFQSIELDAFINIFTTSDTLNGNMSSGSLTNRRSFSSYVLNPISAKQSVYINANYYFGYPDNWFGRLTKNYVNGFNARFIASNNVWKYSDDTIRNVSALYARLGLFHEILPDNYRFDQQTGRSKYSCTIGVNYTFRGMFGDLSSEINDAIREKFLGSRQRHFSGLELNFGFRLNNLRAEFQMPILAAKKGAVDGLTNTQFLFSIKFVGGFGLKLNSSSGEERRDTRNNSSNESK